MKCGKWLVGELKKFVDFCFRLLEMHSLKLVAFTIMLDCCEKVDALHMIIVVMLVFCLPVSTMALRFCFFLVGPYLGILFLTKMTYQTGFIPELDYHVNCSLVNVSFSTVMENTILDPIWWGFNHDDNHAIFITNYHTYIVVLIFMTLETVVRIRQKNKRLEAGLSVKFPSVMYPETTRTDADKTFRDFMKFLFNYGFYKLGVELTLSYCVFVIGFREDTISILYACWVLILILPSRTTISILWPFFLVSVMFSILWQYGMAVGVSKQSCLQYPWEGQEALIKWLYLPNFEHILDSNKILVDFVLLLLIQRQQFGFELEKKYEEKYPGGSNKEDYLSYRAPDFVNPYPDTVTVKGWIDLGKVLFVTCFYRITLALLLWKGASSSNVLSLGYLVAAFVFLWIDFDLCLWKIQKIIKWWNSLLLFITLVILTKPTLQFIGCIYCENYQQFFSIFIGAESKCCSPESEHQATSLFWDTVCFFCVVLQRRYFKSCYFLNEVEDVAGIFKLQSKGARLMDRIQELRMKGFQERQAKTLMKIKNSMKRIKNWQKRMQGPNYKEPTDHETAIYMGDYFMFEDIGEMKLSSSSSEEDFTTGKKDKTSDKEKDEQKKAVTKRRRSAQLFLTPDPKSEKKTKQGEEKSGEPTQRSSSSPPTESTIVQSTCAKIMVFLIHYLNKYSSDYRFIRNVVKRKRKELKIKTNDDFEGKRYSSLISLEENLQTIADISHDDDDEFSSKPVRKLWLPLLKALLDFFMSKTELLCYIVIFIHTVLFPNFVSLALPMMVFLWGSLTTLRPTFTFWTVLIAYSEAVIVIKILFQNKLFSWYSVEGKISYFEYAPLLLGITKGTKFILTDLFLLLVFFLHRYKLKTLGLWNRTHEEETLLPENLKVYKELQRQDEINSKDKRNLIYLKKTLPGVTDSVISMMNLIQTALWKCTSRATAKIYYRGDDARAKILVKEIEGEIIVTHDGRRLQPTFIHISQMNEEEQLGNVVLRVYVDELVLEVKTLINKLSWVQHLAPVRKFFRQILSPDWTMSADFYTLMFIFQFINFLIIFFGYTSFAEPDIIQSSDYFSLTENQVPPMFLFLVIIHFLLIVTDRVLYLRKCLIGKLILHFLLVIIIHIWLFVAIPLVTEGAFSQMVIRQAYYIMSCFYFLMSAYQLRVGYPLRVQGHFLCRRYGLFNYYSYKALQLLPFFNQLRTLLDYLCTHTSLSMMEWIKMESIFEIVFENKCARRDDILRPTARGVKYPNIPKYCPGVFVFLLLIVIIWCPFLIFALFNSVAQPNLPQEAVLKIDIGNFGDIFTSVASYNDIFTFTDGQYKAVQKIFQYKKKLEAFFSLYDNRDVAVLKIRQEPFQPWLITPKEFQLLNETIQNLDLPVTFYFKLNVERIPRSQIVANARGYTEIVLHKGDKARQDLAHIFLNNSAILRLNNVLPKVVHITNEGKVKPVSGFLTPSNVSRRNITMQLMKEGGNMWWRVTELTDDVEEDRISRMPYQTSEDIMIYTFNEKNTPKLLMNVRKRGIIGLYFSIVLVTWTFIRRLMTKYPRLMFEDMPNPDPVLQLCKDIYLARENQEFALEEDLYAKLLFLFRSPETMIKVTRLVD